MKVLITGTASGIGLQTALLFLTYGHTVFGFDILPAAIEDEHYFHYICDVSKAEQLPEIPDVDIIINNAGTIDETKAIATNLEGYINVAEKYAFHEGIKSVVNVGSISGHVGLDTPRYAASQGGRLAYTKNLAMRLANKYRATVNSISPGAVMSGLEPHLYANKKLVDAVANENLLKKWIKPEEIAEWIYFVAVNNRSMTGQDILIDNGEVANFNFISVEDDTDE